MFMEKYLPWMADGWDVNGLIINIKYSRDGRKISKSPGRGKQNEY